MKVLEESSAAATAQKPDSAHTPEQEPQPVIMSHRFKAAYEKMPRARRQMLIEKLVRASEILENIRARQAT